MSSFFYFGRQWRGGAARGFRLRLGRFEFEVWFRDLNYHR